MAKTTFWEGSKSYLCDRSLAQSFHMARVLGMPLLIEGEPGTGKTELAIHYSKEQDLPLFVYPVGSKSNIEQFVARFDHVKYLRDSQIDILNAQRADQSLASKMTTGGRNPENLEDYVVQGPATRAFLNPHSVLLIDEIDKAPREFPNDLLYALSHRKFIMPESGEEISISEEEMPAIIITSNREQELPTAFKGRCIYHYIDFPEEEIMRAIVAKHFVEIDNDLLKVAIDMFYHLRKLGLDRAPTTRELLNWLKYVQTLPKAAALESMQKLDGIGVLIKTQDDLEKIQKSLFRSTNDFQKRSNYN